MGVKFAGEAAYTIPGFNAVYISAAKKGYSLHFFPFIEKASNEHWTSLYCATKDIDQVMEGAKRPVPNKGARRPVPKRVIHFPFAPPKATYTEVGLRPTNPEHAAIWDDYFDFVGEVTVGRELSPTGDEPEYHSDQNVHYGCSYGQRRQAYYL